MSKPTPSRDSVFSLPLAVCVALLISGPGCGDCSSKHHAERHLCVDHEDVGTGVSDAACRSLCEGGGFVTVHECTFTPENSDTGDTGMCSSFPGGGTIFCVGDARDLCV